MLLRELCENMDFCRHIPVNFLDYNIESICVDSRRVTKGALFIALKGAAADGSAFIEDAISKGAAVIVKSDNMHCGVKENVCLLSVRDTKQFLNEILRRFYRNPSGKMKVIGITGTNGKTTLTYLLESILQSAGKQCGVMGTIDYRFGDQKIAAKNTTPGAIDIQKYLSMMAERKIEYCAMEVSSHALAQDRISGVDFRAAIFTNLTSDHLDYHQNRENYFLAKAILFKDLSKDAVAILNSDDPYAERLIGMTGAAVVKYGTKQAADVLAEDIRLGLKGTNFTLKADGHSVAIFTPLIGLHNVYNVLAASAACLREGITLQQIKEGVARLNVVPGRMEPIDGGQDFSVFVDYAHTEDALKNILQSIKNVTNAKIILVFGCGGDRDKTKRPKMGKAASALADWVIVTSDNPRSEDPRSIIEEILAGFEGQHYEAIVNREEAIKKSMLLAKSGDVVIVAGKGHEDYQIFKDKTIPFDERQIVKRFLREIKETSSV